MKKKHQKTTPFMSGYLRQLVKYLWTQLRVFYAILNYICEIEWNVNWNKVWHIEFVKKMDITLEKRLKISLSRLVGFLFFNFSWSFINWDLIGVSN